MSAHEQMRMMLDQLMGTGRDGENNRYKVKFTDPRVCKSFLLGCCPHDILASTRMDLGECSKIHDLALRADYEQASKLKDYYYDIDAMEHLQAFINDCDRRTELAKRRLADTQEELSAEVAAKANKVHELAEQIGKKLARAEQLGAEGNVEESLKLMEEVEEIRKKKALAEQEYRNSMPASSYQQQKLRVCEVCSAYLGIHDNDRRLADHFGGKLHLGFIKIREKLEELKTAEPEEVCIGNIQRTAQQEEKSVNDRREKQKAEREREKEREERKAERSRDGDSGDHGRNRKRSRSRSSSRSRSHHSRRSHRSGSRSRRSRSRSRSRRSRSRSSSKKRSRSSRRSRSKDRRRSRDSSKDHKRDRSRSRDHRRSSDKDEKEKSPKDKER